MFQYTTCKVIGVKQKHLRSTRSDVCWLEPDPTWLSAKHWYIPVSEDCRSVMVRDGKNGVVRLILGSFESISIIFPLSIFLQYTTVSCGLAVTSHSRVTSPPRSSTYSFCRILTTGGAKITKIILKNQYDIMITTNRFILKGRVQVFLIVLFLPQETNLDLSYKLPVSKSAKLFSLACLTFNC